MSKRRSGAASVTLSQVLEKYWELANLDPEVTKGTITGQLKALDSLCVELAEGGEEKAVLKSAAVYRSAWMPQPGREN